MTLVGGGGGGGWFEVTLSSKHSCLFPPPLPLSFSGYLLEVLNRSEVALQDVYGPQLGPLYTQNSLVFSDLYMELRRYCRTANVNLEEALNDFWARLLERLFNQANKQYIIGMPSFFHMTFWFGHKVILCLILMSHVYLLTTRLGFRIYIYILYVQSCL